jgi:hypothetical protein
MNILRVALVKKSELEKYKVDQKVKVLFFVSGLLVAFVLALVRSPYTGEAFAMLAGLMGGNAIHTK